ncbi:MAG TPA: hypothetical protein VFP68_22800 [Burkholderiaceae bacterium]|nr:hypothetical protein [Burkholderiaceae bacterium]
MPAGAVDGAGLHVEDVFGILAILFGAALPFLLVGGTFVLAVLMVRSISRKASSDGGAFEPDALLPPASGQVSITTEDIGLMLQWGVFFDGTNYRFAGQVPCRSASTRAKG